MRRITAWMETKNMVESTTRRSIVQEKLKQIRDSVYAVIQFRGDNRDQADSFTALKRIVFLKNDRFLCLRRRMWGVNGKKEIESTGSKKNTKSHYRRSDVLPSWLVTNPQKTFRLYERINSTFKVGKKTYPSYLYDENKKIYIFTEIESW